MNQSIINQSIINLPADRSVPVYYQSMMDYLGIHVIHKKSIPSFIRQIKVLFEPCDDLDNTGDCTICLSEYKKGDIIGVIPCGHHYHYDCCFDWFKTNVNNTCPLCRSKLTSDIVLDCPFINKVSEFNRLTLVTKKILRKKIVLKTKPKPQRNKIVLKTKPRRNKIVLKTQSQSQSQTQLQLTL